MLFSLRSFSFFLVVEGGENRLSLHVSRFIFANCVVTCDYEFFKYTNCNNHFFYKALQSFTKSNIHDILR